MKKIFLVLLLLIAGMIGFTPLHAQQVGEDIPGVLHGFEKRDGKTVFVAPDSTVFHEVSSSRMTLAEVVGKLSGTDKGIRFSFGDSTLSGMIYFGLIHYSDGRYPLPVYRSAPVQIVAGKAEINLDVVRGRYDMTGWEDKGFGTLGYRAIDDRGEILYDGKVNFSGTGPFHIENTILEGPFVQNIQASSATIWFRSSLPTVGRVEVNGKTFSEPQAVTNHEIRITGLQPGRPYKYKVTCDQDVQEYMFRTAHPDGAREPFVFAYASDSRGGAGWGERNIYGTNGYIVKKIMAVAAAHEVAFMQFTGDLISGYKTVRGEMELQYHNWKSVTEPFGHYFPVYAGMGNHESFGRAFSDGSSGWPLSVDHFPYDLSSSETVFADEFVNPENGPVSEDGAVYDPDPGQTDFPPYRETAFWYRYDNVAVVSLNSNYWYTPAASAIPHTGGNPHGYIMDNQLDWMSRLLTTFEKDETIDHVFITVHTPFFPNSAHVGDDMWYNGNNMIRPWVNGKPVEKGIIERRDQLLDLAVNKSSKVVAFLTGDEHNYCRTEIGPETPKYPENYASQKIDLKRTVWQINNGAAGAPYYAQVQTPWSAFTSNFTTQNAVCLFYVDGKRVKMVVINPDTLDEVDSFQLR